jgi:cis-L-3-hydroxyproline dehydratase
MAQLIVAARARGKVLLCDEGLSFWGGVDPETGVIVDAHHPQHGEALAGRVVMMPTSRGSCTGSGVLLDLALAGNAPAALIFHEAEDILTLGAMIAARMFDRRIAVLRLSNEEYAALAHKTAVEIADTCLKADDLEFPLSPLTAANLHLSTNDRAMLEGRDGRAAQLAMEMICAMAAVQGAERLIDVSRVHIDGCIYAGPAFLTFARTMADMEAKVRVPTTMNAISVDHANWRAQGVDEAFGNAASSLADAYVRMGAHPSFTCAPYLLEDRPTAGEEIAWAESNAVIYANSVLGARTVKHPDFLDLCIALTGRAPRSGVYERGNRAPRRIIEVAHPDGADDAFWPMLGWLAGHMAPDRIPLLCGLETARPNEDDLKALCAAFGTTSAAPMLHVAGVTPEADLPTPPDIDSVSIGPSDFARVWRRFNAGGGRIDLVALGSPHFSISECRAFAELMTGRHVHPDVTTIVTLGRATLEIIRKDGTEARLKSAGVTILPDLCWCSISEPVFPRGARVLMTNSGKYAHYAPGLCGREVRFGSLSDCADAAETGAAPKQMPVWLS